MSEAVNVASETATPGARYKCTQCGTEVVVIKADDAIPRCCGKLMETPAK
jgi:DNA-directed RNA polymerase subunit RPC12/RpoP